MAERSIHDTLQTVDVTPPEPSSGVDTGQAAARLTILYHADLHRIGEVSQGRPFDAAGRPLVIGRRAPLFGGRSGTGRPIDDQFISREHFTLRWLPEAGRFEIAPNPAARRPLFEVELERAAPQRRIESVERLAPGAVIAIGNRVLLLLSVSPEAPPEPDALGLVGESAAMAALRERIRTVARFRESALVLGETGTGKELVARALHRLGGAPGAFVALNMGGIDVGTASSELFGHVRGAFTGAHRDVDGAFSSARRGTLFLDEIGDLPMEVQKKLLRVLEERRFTPLGGRQSIEADCRVVAATNAPLAADITAGQFRRDLYERLVALCIVVPSLRQRREDVPRLFCHFLAEQVREHPELGWMFAGDEEGTPPVPMEFMIDLLRRAWPGNVRELRNVATATAAANLVGRRFVPPVEPPRPLAGASAPDPRLRQSGSATPVARVPSTEEMEEALGACRGNVRAAATRLGCSRHQLYRWMTARGLDPQRFREAGTEED